MVKRVKAWPKSDRFIRIIHGDSFEEVRRLDSASIDSLICDPPAGIGFMGKSWDSYSERDGFIKAMEIIFMEVYRILKPGSHGFVWAIPRTSHWTAMAMENVGFEIRDVVTHLFGSGFPKSLDISKAIDKAAGAGLSFLPTTSLSGYGLDNDGNQGFKGGKFKNSNVSDTVKNGNAGLEVTAPATDAAKHWDGWGTALKPSSEHWILIRKPLQRKTVVENVQRWGVGGINIDGSRIPNNDKSTARKRNISIQGGNFVSNKFETDGIIAGGHSAGRWPANTILSHHADCVRVGTKEIKGITGGNSTNVKNKVYGKYNKGLDQTPCGHKSETVDAYDCHPECPVKMLDEQSLKNGMHSAGNKKSSDIKAGPMFGIGDIGKRNPDIYADIGGASRFFYAPKPSKSERGEGNDHPTVKPLALMKYLITMITPEGGVILDPFAGSGTTLLAAKQLRFSVIGIEREKEYVEIIKRRCGLK